MSKTKNEVINAPYMDDRWYFDMYNEFHKISVIPITYKLH